MGTLTPTILSLSVGLIIGIIGYFLKRTMSRVDKNEQDINSVKENFTPAKTHDKDFSACQVEIKQIKEDYITKEDFFREQNKTDRKLDRIMDILLEMKGGSKNE